MTISSRRFNADDKVDVGSHHDLKSPSHRLRVPLPPLRDHLQLSMDATSVVVYPLRVFGRRNSLEAIDNALGPDREHLNNHQQCRHVHRKSHIGDLYRDNDI